jgi:hypothetical protein
MSTLTREDEQQNELSKITRRYKLGEKYQVNKDTSFKCGDISPSFLYRCTPNDLKYIVRLIKHDLKINAGAKHV